MGPGGGYQVAVGRQLGGVEADRARLEDHSPVILFEHRHSAERVARAVALGALAFARDELQLVGDPRLLERPEGPNGSTGSGAMVDAHAAKLHEPVARRPVDHRGPSVRNCTPGGRPEE